MRIYQLETDQSPSGNQLSEVRLQQHDNLSDGYDPGHRALHVGIRLCIFSVLFMLTGLWVCFELNRK